MIADKRFTCDSFVGLVILGWGTISFQNPALLVPHRAVYSFIPILSNPVGFEVGEVPGFGSESGITSSFVVGDPRGGDDKFSKPCSARSSQSGLFVYSDPFKSCRL